MNFYTLTIKTMQCLTLLKNTIIDNSSNSFSHCYPTSTFFLSYADLNLRFIFTKASTEIPHHDPETILGQFWLCSLKNRSREFIISKEIIEAMSEVTLDHGFEQA